MFLCNLLLKGLHIPSFCRLRAVNKIFFPSCLRVQVRGTDTRCIECSHEIGEACVVGQLIRQSREEVLVQWKDLSTRQDNTWFIAAYGTQSVRVYRCGRAFHSSLSWI